MAGLPDVVGRPAEVAPTGVIASLSAEGILVGEVEGTAPGSDEEFAEWYVWSKREVSSDPRVCLGIAQAAIEALANGADRQAAETAARRSVAGLAVVLLSHVPPRRQAYAEWYDWARLDIGGDKERLHRITRAAIQCLESGGSAAEAVEVARNLARAETAPAAASAPSQPPQSPAPAVPPPPPAAAPVPAPPVTLPMPASASAQAPIHGPPLAAGPSTSPVVVAPPIEGRAGSLPAAWPAAPGQREPEPDLLAYGGFWRRVAAFLIDAVLGLIAGAIVYVVAALLWVVAVASNGGATSGVAGVALAILVVWAVLFWVYYAGLESSPWQATVGKRALGLIVTDTFGRRISFARATGRHFAKLLSLICIGIGFFMIGGTRRKQGLHDKAAGTLVVRRRYLSRVQAQTSPTVTGRVGAEAQQRV